MKSLSVVVETVTVRHDHDHGPLADALARTMEAVCRQTVALHEVLVVLDPSIGEPEEASVRLRYPEVRIVRADKANYFAEKNAGVRAATGDLVAFLDGDCVPAETWAETLIGAFTDRVVAVTGETRYEGGSFAARTFSVPDFGNAMERRGSSTAIMLNNVAFLREVAEANPLEERIPRNGGCFLLYHRLRTAGAVMVYESRATVTHELDVGGLGFVRKHFDRGFDGVVAYRCDDTGVLRGTSILQRFGPFGLTALSLRRILLDWVNLARHRQQVGIGAIAVPYYAAVLALTRSIELVGGLTALATERNDRAA